MKFKSIILFMIFSTFLFASNNSSLVLSLLKKHGIKNVVGFVNTPSQKPKIIEKKIFIEKIKKITKYKILKTPVIYFNFNSYKLNNRDIKILQTLIKEYKNKNVLIVLKGFTDKPGTKKYNLKLSKKRTLIVKNFLIKNGIKEKNIIIKYYGNNDLLINTNKPEEINRRVVIEVLPFYKSK